MPSRWLRWFRSPSESSTYPEVPADLAAAYLDMERRLEYVQRAVGTAIKLTVPASLVAEWDAARDRAYAATTQYLDFAAPGSAHTRPATDAAAVARDIAASSAELDAFYERHRRSLEGAAGAALSARTGAEEALAATQPVLQRLAALAPELAGYPSVRSARDQVESARAAVQSALDSGDVGASSAVAQRLRMATTALDEAVAAAPHRGEQARRTLTSVRTRLDAITHRADSSGTAFSLLLKEFHADSSADLRDNERRARTHIAAAHNDIEQSAAALKAHQPEDAVRLAAQARDEIAHAEELVDAVAHRLEALRSFRADPTVRERDVRFRIRDAQRLAVDRGAVAEWGTALDAQVARVDRIVAALDVRHPDYWKYHLDLEEVSRFVNSIVARIRTTSSTR